MSLSVTFLFITFCFSIFQEPYVATAENSSETCTVKEFGTLEEKKSYSLEMTNVDQEGLFPLKVKAPYDRKNCWYINRVVVKVYNPSNKPKIGLKYLTTPLIYAYVKYGLWQQFISHVEVTAYSLPTLSCGEDVLDESPWGERNDTEGGNKKHKKTEKKDDT